MVQSKPRFATFEEYLAAEDRLEGRYEFIDGELVEVPPESDPNLLISQELFWVLAIANIIPRQLIRLHACELQVPILKPKDPANRYPDLVVLRAEHIPLLNKRSTITLSMVPPQLVVEVVSPGQENRDRDYVHKRDQYAARGIPEYWIIDPEYRMVLVMVLEGNSYKEMGTFQGNTSIASPSFPELKLTPEQILHVE